MSKRRMIEKRHRKAKRKAERNGTIPRSSAIDLHITEAGRQHCLGKDFRRTVASIYREQDHNAAAFYIALALAADSSGQVQASDAQIVRFITENADIIAKILKQALEENPCPRTWFEAPDDVAALEELRNKGLVVSNSHCLLCAQECEHQSRYAYVHTGQLVRVAGEDLDQIGEYRICPRCQKLANWEQLADDLIAKDASCLSAEPASHWEM